MTATVSSQSYTTITLLETVTTYTVSTSYITTPVLTTTLDFSSLTYSSTTSIPIVIQTRETVTSLYSIQISPQTSTGVGAPSLGGGLVYIIVLVLATVVVLTVIIILRRRGLK